LGISISQPNEFQLNCEKALVSALGIPIAYRKIAGVSERYITGFLPGTELKIFIYLDGAEVTGRTVDENGKRCQERFSPRNQYKMGTVNSWMAKA
jgi:hypothetical protein